MKKIQPNKTRKQKVLVVCIEEENLFWDITPKPEIKILWKLVCLKASTKPHVKKIQNFPTYVAFTQWPSQTSTMG